MVEREPARLIYAAAWSIVLVACAALAVGAVNMSSNMDARLVEFEVMVGWGLGALVQWLLVEPAALCLFASCGLVLKWCTSFEDLPPPPKGDAGAAARPADVAFDEAREMDPETLQEEALRALEGPPGKVAAVEGGYKEA